MSGFLLLLPSDRYNKNFPKILFTIYSHKLKIHSKNAPSVSMIGVGKFKESLIETS